MSIMRISSLEFGLLPGGGVWLLPGSIASISSSSPPLIGFSINVGLQDIFLELLLLSRNSYKVTIKVSVPTSVTVLEGLRGTINLQDYSLASIHFLPQHQRKQYPFRDIIQSDGNPSTSTGYSIVIHRSPFQIIQPIIQFECLSSGSSRFVYASRYIRWSIAYYGQLSMWHRS